jgi:hypothetical protein
VRAINEYGGANAHKYQAYYLSGPYDPPGIICVEFIDVGMTTDGSGTAFDSAYDIGDNFAVECSSSNSYYEPEIKAHSSTASLSSISKTDNEVTVTFSSGHGLKTGDWVNITRSNNTDVTGGLRQVRVTSTTVIKFDDPYYTAGTNSVATATYAFKKASQHSTVDGGLNRLYYSKLNEPEHVPLDNYFDIGSADWAIVRIFPTNDALWVLKEDGLFRLLGNSAETFEWEEFDLTAKIIAPESVASLSNQLFFLSNQGVVSASDSGVTKVSRPIEKDLIKLDATAVRNAASACSYETEGLYILNLPADAGDTADNEFAFVYNIWADGGAWTKWNVSCTWMKVNPEDGLLYAGDAAGKKTLVERKTFTARDYADKQYSVTVSGSPTNGGLTFTLSSSTPGYEVGDLVYFSDSVRGIITAVNSSTNVTVDTNMGLADTNAVTIFKHYDFDVQYQAIVGENPNAIKHLSEASVHFRTPYFSTIKVGFISDLSPVEETYKITGFAKRGRWAEYPWDHDDFSGEIGPRSFKSPIPRQKARASQLFVRLSHAIALEKFSIEGISVTSAGGDAGVIET